LSWQAILQTLPLLNIDEAEIFAPPREMEAAIASYNRALVNMRSDSADIAQIALRKLVISYPLFGPASLLYGACMVEQGRFPAAAELISRARLAGLKQQEVRLAESLTERIAQLTTEEAPPTNSTAKQEAKSTAKPVSLGQSAGASVLEHTHRPVKARMASRKEVQNVLRHGDVPEHEQTRVVSERSPQEKFRLALIGVAAVIVVLVLSLAITAAVRSLKSAKTLKTPNDRERLDYLLAQLDQLSGSDPAIAGLMANYNDFITPTMPMTTSAEMATSASVMPETSTSSKPNPTTSTNAVQTSAQSAATSEPAGSTTPTDLLTQVYSEYQAALILAKTDSLTAAEALLKARKSAEGLDPALSSPAVPMSVSELTAKISGALDQYSGKAAETLRVQGKTAYDLKDNKTSLDRYLRAYQLQPLYYNGAVAYYCGRNYQALKQYDLAKPYYELVIQNFAGKELANFAATRLAEMGFATAPTTAATTQPATQPATQASQ
jgi:tetratricopeptide (TPR) repeat protein